LIALKPQPGHWNSLSREIQSLEMRGRAVRRGRLGSFDIVELLTESVGAEVALKEISGLPSLHKQSAVYFTSDDNVPFIPTGTIFLSFADPSNQEAADDVLRRHFLVILRCEEEQYLTVATNGDAVVVSALLQSEPAVRVAEPDLVTPRQPAHFLLSDDKSLGKYWHLNNTGSHDGRAFGSKSGADARVVEAWYSLGNLGSDSVLIAIIDDGFDQFNSDPHSRERDHWIQSPAPAHVERRQFDGECTRWHGAICAAIAAGRTDSDEIVGAAPNARILPISVGPDINTDDLARIFDFASSAGAWVVNCSWSPKAKYYPLGQRLILAISRCANNGRNGLGIPVVFAVGNENANINDGDRLNGFAVHSDVIAVAASTSLDQRSDTSNYGGEVSLCAPSSGAGGWSIIAGSGANREGNATRTSVGHSHDYFQQFGGTSCSSALVAGICGLVLSAAPRLRAEQLRQMLRKTARRIGGADLYGPDGRSDFFGFGCVDAAAAVAAARASLANRM